MTSEGLQEGTRRKKRHLWRLSETLCLNPAGGLTCHSASSFCSRLQAILLSACTRGKGSIELQPNREGKPTGLPANRTDWGEEGGCLPFGKERRSSSWGWGLGSWGRESNCGEDGRRPRGRGREATRERNRSAVGNLPFFICGFFYVGPLCENTCKWILLELFPLW